VAIFVNLYSPPDHQIHHISEPISARFTTPRMPIDHTMIAKAFTIHVLGRKDVMTTDLKPCSECYTDVPPPSTVYQSNQLLLPFSDLLVFSTLLKIPLRQLNLKVNGHYVMLLTHVCQGMSLFLCSELFSASKSRKYYEY
jgi:hypothetical protein